MILLRSRFRVIAPDSAHLILITRPSRRAGFLLAFLILAATMIVAFDPQVDLQHGRLVMTVIFVLLAFGCLWAGVRRQSVLFDLNRGRIEFRTGLMGTWGKPGALAVGDIDAVCLQKLALRRNDFKGGSERPVGSGRVPGFGSSRFSMNVLCKLALEVSGRRVPIEPSAFHNELDAAGKQIAGFLNVPYRIEEI